MSEILCEICFEAFNDENIIPKLLECGHTICSLCLYKLFQTSKMCPKCSQLMEKQSTEEFATNYFILTLTSTCKRADLSYVDKMKKVVAGCKPLLNLASSELAKIEHRNNLDDKDLVHLKETEMNVEKVIDNLNLWKKSSHTFILLKEFRNSYQFMYTISTKLQEGNVLYAMEYLNGKPKYGLIKYSQKHIVIYSLSVPEVDKTATIIWFSDLQNCVTIDNLSLVLKLDKGDDQFFHATKNCLLPMFLKLLTGVERASFRGVQYERNGYGIEVNHYFLDGLGTQGPIDYCFLANVEQEFEGCGTYALEGNINGSFKAVVYKDKSFKSCNVIGTSSCFSYSSSGVITNCGIALKLL